MIIAIVIAVLVLLFVLIAYNSLISKRNMVDNAFAMIDTQLKKRCDLIPNLVSSVKAYMKHESSTLTAITEMRAKAMSPSATPEEKIDITNKLSSAMRSIMVSVESYPDLKASDNMQMLMRSLNEVEEQLSAARRSYNAAVTDFNTAIQIFPYVLFAGMLGFTKRELLVITEEERKNPNVGKLFE